MLKRHLSAATLDKLLRSELIEENIAEDKRSISYLMKKVFKVGSDEQEK